MEKLVKVRFLKNCMQWNEGQEVEFPESKASEICQVRIKQVGEGQIEKFQVAMPVEEIERLKDQPIDKGGLTVDELKAMGLKNVVKTPDSEVERPFAPFFKETKEDKPVKSKK